MTFPLTISRALPEQEISVSNEDFLDCEILTNMISLRVRQTPSRILASVDCANVFKSRMISPTILSPNLREMSATVLPAVYNLISPRSRKKQG